MKKIFIFLLSALPAILFAGNNLQTTSNDLSKHYAALPHLYELEKITKEQLSDKITRQYVMGSQSMIVKWTLKKGALISLHFHPAEQITWITKGSVKVVSQNKEFIVRAGGVLIIPPYVPHEFYALEDTIDIDYFTPIRDDWLNNTANYLKT